MVGCIAPKGRIKPLWGADGRKELKNRGPLKRELSRFEAPKGGRELKNRGLLKDELYCFMVPTQEKRQ